MKITSKEFHHLVKEKGKASVTKDVLVQKQGYRFMQPLDGRDNVLRFVFTSKNVDLQGDRVNPEGLDFKNYLERNPLILLHHDTRSLPIGKTIALNVTDENVIGDIEFFTDLDEANVGTNARAAVELVKRGTMGISITFIPKNFDLNSTDGVDFHEAKIIEVSVVSVPCNTDAYLVEGQNTQPEMVEASAPDEDVIRKAELALKDRARKAAARKRAILLAD